MGRFRGGWVIMGLLAVAMLGVACAKPAALSALDVPEDAVARLVYFYAEDCPHCAAVREKVLDPLQGRCGSSLEIKVVDVGTPAGYEAFIATERAFIGEAGRWDLPTLVVGEEHFTGERAIQEGLLPHLQCVYDAGGNDWPEVEALVALPTADATEKGGSGAACVDEEADVCALPVMVYALYYTQTDCPDICERTRYDLRYLQGVFPGLSFEERDIDEDRALAEALAEHYGLPEAQRGVAPAVFVGEDALVGEALTLDALRATLEKYEESGATAVWYVLDVE